MNSFSAIDLTSLPIWTGGKITLVKEEALTGRWLFPYGGNPARIPVISMSGLGMTLLPVHPITKIVNIVP